VNYGTFFQGIGTLGGGNIRLKAGADIADISASVPETIQVSGGTSASGPAATAHYFGGGDLLVQAGGNLYSSTFYVGRGTAEIQVGGTVAADPKNPVTGTPTVLTSITYQGGRPVLGATSPLPLLLAVQDGFVSLSSAQSITLGDVFDPAHIPFDTEKLGASLTFLKTSMPAGIGAAFNTYGPSSGIALTSVAGDVTLNTVQPSAGTTIGATDALFVKLAYGGAVTSNAGTISGIGGDTDDGVQPATLNATALGGNIFLANSVTIVPSPIGNVSLTAGQSISTEILDTSEHPFINQITMADSGSATLLGVTSSMLSSAIHAADPVPVTIYAGSDITGSFSLIKPVKIEAGRDIIDTDLVGQNNNAGDISSVIAGRDILARQLIAGDGSAFDFSTTFVTYGPGTLLVQAGRNLGPFFTGLPGAAINPIQVGAKTLVSGIETIGDGGNLGTLAVKSYLSNQGANIYALFGVGAGIDYDVAKVAYVDPAFAGTGGINFLTDIAMMLHQTPIDAWTTFKSLSAAQQRLLIDRAFLDFIAQVGIDYNNPASAYYHQYARAYDAIATLFPASLGYTDNAATGTNGAAVTRSTGDLNMAHSLLQTQAGGDIALIGPGGNIFVGANAADNTPVNSEGILTLQGGSILTYTDQSVIVDQSRIFTEQGGDVDLFSANGNLNAGKGPKSAASFPPLSLIWDPDSFARVNPAGLVTGAGIGALISVPGQDPSLSNVDLVAPHGTVDAGAAGVRVSGNLNIAALQVLNAFNIQVGGIAIGIPTAPPPPIGALTAGNDAAGAAAKTAALPQQSNAGEQPSIIMVEFLGFGGGDDDASPAGRPQQDKRKQDDERHSQNDSNYDPYSPVHLLGDGALTDRQKKKLSQDERNNLERVIGQSSSH
jgi:Filamentous haemagglutinin family outer membrane protein